MYYRLVASVTRDHLREHLGEYLSRVEAASGESLTLLPPRSFELGSIVGGVLGLSLKKDFPAWAIDAYDKTPSNDTASLWTHRYNGRITGAVASNDMIDAEAQAKAFLAVTELFFAEHQFFPYSTTFNPDSLPFTFMESQWVAGQTFGAADLGKPKGQSQSLWMDGFSADIAWFTSEQGVGQHD